MFVYATQAHAPDLMIEPDGSVYRFVKDHLGSVRRVVNVATGATAQRLEYDTFGHVTLDTNPRFQPFGFAGGLYDPDTSLVHFGARDYDASVGRWLAKDPILFAGGDTNLYAYVGNDPVNWVDPSGLYLESALDVISIGYDIYAIVNDNILGDCDNLGWNVLALGADIVGLLIPFATGLGAAVHVAAHADDAIDVARRADDVLDAARGAPNRGIFYVDSRGNVIPTPPGGRITGSPDGRFIQARDAAGNPTGVRIDGPHRPATHPDPRAQQPHGHVPGVTNPDGTPWLPINQ